jgi:uncharacterized repeat protein (TIGR03803 family)
MTICQLKRSPSVIVKQPRPALGLLSALGLVIGVASPCLANGIVMFEAESGNAGANFTNGTSGAVQFISVSTPSVNSGNPGNVARVASYTVTFPSAGTYNLFARVRVGPDPFNDDSLFYGNGFGTNSATTDSDWMLVNGLASGGFTASGDIVAGNGSAGSQVWKWVNLSQFNPSGSATETPITFTVSAGSLTQTFQIGARENGLDFDRFAFGTIETSFAVSNLDDGTIPFQNTLTNTFVGPDENALHRFNPLTGELNLDGANPAAGLGWFNGVLVGTTFKGGLQGTGTAFWMSPDGTNFSTFRTFTNSPDARNPQGALSFAGTRFFSTTFSGGSSGTGTVIAGQTNGSVLVLRNFTALDANTATNSGGAAPNAALASSGAMVFGTTTTGGVAANGTIFAVTTNGANFTVLHDFTLLDSQAGTNTDGASPQGGVILSGDKLYGVASAGGAGGCGVIFSIGTNGANFATLHSFSPLAPLTGTNTDGAFPLGGLVLSNATLYGTTISGGSGGGGTIFSVQTNGGGFAVWHDFAAVDPVTKTNADGASPCAALLLSSNVLYGTASAGGAGAAGTVFSLNLVGAQFAALRSFSAVANNGTNADGAFPVAPVTRVGNTLYGTTFAGGPGAVGTVFGVVIPAPVTITSILNNLNGSVTLNFSGGPNSTNIVQATSDLSATPIIWQNVSTNLGDGNGWWQFTDVTISSNRFYRAKSL